MPFIPVNRVIPFDSAKSNTQDLIRISFVYLNQNQSMFQSSR